MYEKLEECPSCKHSKFTNHIICQDYSVSNESFALVKCNKCDLIFTNPRPDQESIGKYYKSDNYISHTNEANNLINVIYKGVRNITLRQKHSLITSYTKEKHLLDYGCGTATFLKFCKDRGFEVAGYEPDPDARTIATETLQQEILYRKTHLKKSAKFDVITAWHVIEHVHDLKDTIKLLRKRLTDEGYMFVAVPNINSYDASHYGQHWAAYDVPRHLYHFTRDSFAKLADKCKLQIRDIHPMKFDAFYVSMLSEQYKNNSSNLSDAFKTGYKSNKLAQESGEYSSLIYVLRKK